MARVPASMRSVSGADAGWLAAPLWASDLLDHQGVCDLEPVVVDQPADAVQYRGFGFEGGGVAEHCARLLDGGVLAAREVLPVRDVGGPKTGRAGPSLCEVEGEMLSRVRLADVPAAEH
jgi:hypothetical protein